MKRKVRESLKKYFGDLSNYEDFLVKIECLLKKNNILRKLDDEIFWNHIISLFKRIENDEQNNFEVIDDKELKDESLKIANSISDIVEKNFNKKITEFEKFLIQIYAQKAMEGGNDNG